MRNSVRVLLYACCGLLFTTQPAAADVLLPNFSGAPGITLLDTAAIVATTVGGNPHTSARVTPSFQAGCGAAGPCLDRGAVWFNDPQGILGGFETNFLFEISDPKNDGAPGFAFVLQAGDLATIGDGQEWLGYTRMGNAVAIEFDTTKQNFDTSAPEVSLLVPLEDQGVFSLQAEYSLLSSPWPAGLPVGGLHEASIIYVPGALEVYLDGVKVLESPLDLSTVAGVTWLPGGEAYVGFTSGSAQEQGRGSANHDIHGWSFTEKAAPGIPEPSALALLAAGLCAFRAYRCRPSRG